MIRTPFIIAMGDLILLFLYGAVLCYMDQTLAYIDQTTILMAAFMPSLFLGLFGPSLGEIAEWILFFFLGVLSVHLYPYYNTYLINGSIPLNTLLLSTKNALLYSLNLFYVWSFGVPLGYLFYKLTSTPYYKETLY